MPRLNKLASGLLLQEDFKKESLIWTPSPNNYIKMAFSDDGLRIVHDANIRKTYTVQCPEGDWTFIGRISHDPFNPNDIGGVVVMSDNEYYVECQSFRTEEKPKLYGYIKVTHARDIFTFFASVDDGLSYDWETVGSVTSVTLQETCRIGFFLHNCNVPITDSHFYVKGAAFYSGDRVIISNAKNAEYLELRSSDTKIITESGKGAVSKVGDDFYISTTLMPMPMKNVRLVLLNKNRQIMLEDTIGEFCGGDVYEYGYNIAVFIEDVEIDPTMQFTLDGFHSRDQVFKIDIYNRENYEMNDLEVRISAGSVYYGGNEVLGISLYDDNETEYEFNESVIIDSILPNEGRTVMIKLTDEIVQNFYMKQNEYRFRLNIG